MATEMTGRGAEFAGRPDEDFVLHGRNTPIRTKSSDHKRTYLTNSEKTLTSHNLSHSTLHRPESRTSTLRSNGSQNGQEGDVLFDSAYSSKLRKSLSALKKQRAKDSEFSLDLRSLNSSLSKSFNKSVSFNSHLPKRNEGDDKDDEESLADMFEEELQKLIDNDEQELHQQETLVGKPANPSTSEWFTQPVHLTKTSEYPVFESLGVDVHNTSPTNRSAGVIGTELAQHRVSSEILLDDLAREYFPATLGAMPSISRTITPPPPFSMSSFRPSSAKSEPSRTWAYPKRPPSSTQRHSNVGSAASKLQAMEDYNYLQASQPFIDQSVSATPHQYELAKLRMERLRIEEETILENKRQEELERIRGPKPKWYEMKTPNFTYEHFKNNQLLKSQDRWQELMDYRSQLTKTSQQFSKGRSPDIAPSFGTSSARFAKSSDPSPTSFLRTASREYANDYMHTTPVV